MPVFDPHSFKVVRVRRRIGGANGPALDLGFAVYGVARTHAEDERGVEAMHPAIFATIGEAGAWRERIAADYRAIDIAKWIVPIEEVARDSPIRRPHVLNPALYCPVP